MLVPKIGHRTNAQMNPTKNAARAGVVAMAASQVAKTLIHPRLASARTRMNMQMAKGSRRIGRRDMVDVVVGNRCWMQRTIEGSVSRVPRGEESIFSGSLPGGKGWEASEPGSAAFGGVGSTASVVLSKLRPLFVSSVLRATEVTGSSLVSFPRARVAERPLEKRK
jgi:hypothetical protein